MSDLKPCPFCGGEASERHFYGGMYGIYRDEFGVYCDKCSARVGGLYATEAEAIAAWNTRADYHGYEQAAIEAWESIKAWNSRVERTCKNVDDHKTVWFICSVCGYQQKLSHTRSYCPNCGARVVE